MYDFIHDIAIRPQLFSIYTAKDLWTSPYLSNQMLNFHLDQNTDMASRRLTEIDEIVGWLDKQLVFANKHVCDLGCGPGLYANQFAKHGATVTGIDFSKTSINYATEHSAPDVSFIHADYLEDELPEGFDIVTLIYTDYCALSPLQRSNLLAKIKDMLNADGYLVLDVASTGLLKTRQEITLIEDNLMGGFWSSSKYVGIQKSFIYENELVSLDRFVIVEPTKTWQIYNWFQYFTPEMIKSELSDAGFKISNIWGDLKGSPLVSANDYIGVLAKPS